MIQTSYFKCLPTTSNKHYSLGMGSLASVQNQMCQQSVAFDHSIFTTYFIALFCYAFSAWLYHHHTCTSNLLTALHLHTDARLTLCTIHTVSLASVYTQQAASPYHWRKCSHEYRCTSWQCKIYQLILDFFRNKCGDKIKKTSITRCRVNDTDATGFTVKILPDL